jgi:hypothetical protein
MKKALKIGSVIVSMWWIVTTYPGPGPNPSGQPVQIWIGGFDTESICRQTLTGLRSDVNTDWNYASCRFTGMQSAL